MNNKSLSFGFSTMYIGSLTIYACKVRVKMHVALDANEQHIHAEYSGDGNTTTISYSVLCPVLAEQLSQRIGVMLRDHAQQMLDTRYAWVR